MILGNNAHLLTQVLSYLSDIQDCMTGPDAKSYSQTIQSLRAENYLTPAKISKKIASSVLAKYLVTYKPHGTQNWLVWQPFESNGQSLGFSYPEIKLQATFDVAHVFKPDVIQDRVTLIEQNCLRWCRLKIFRLAESA